MRGGNVGGSVEQIVGGRGGGSEDACFISGEKGEEEFIFMSHNFVHR